MEGWKLCDSEYRFMNVVWDSAPVPSGELVALCAEQLVKKLAQKGLLRNENAVVTALVPREDVQAEESAAFVERTFDGSLPAFLAAFMGGRTISDEEARQIQALIDEHRKG